MPRNQRPTGLFGEFDYGWEGTTLNERIQAQNIWDLLDAQEKANYYHDVVFAAMNELRAVSDEMETITSSDYWPYPTYDKLLFGV